MSSAHINSDLRSSAEETLRSEWEEAKCAEVSDMLSAEATIRRCGLPYVPRSLGELLLESARLDLGNVLAFCLRSVDISYRNKIGDSALHFAARGGHTRICSYLIQHGLSANSTNRLHETALMYASEAGHLSVVEYLLTCSEVGIRNEFGQTALHIAAREGKVAVCEAILRKTREGVNAEDQSGMTPLGYAGEMGLVETMKVLEKYGGRLGTRG